MTMQTLLIALATTVAAQAAPSADKAAPAPKIPTELVAPGDFEMGAQPGPDWQKADYKGPEWDEQPVHRVTISRGFAIGAGEVTNAQYEAFDPQHRKLRGFGGSGAGDDDPVVMVRWDEAAAFCKWLSERTGRPYRLPTEAEWEHACRAAESLGLRGMEGGVGEWCSDWWAPYRAEAQTDPIGPTDGDVRVYRGGRPTNRSATVTGDRQPGLGFRVVQAPPLESAPAPLPELPEVFRNVSQEKRRWARQAADKPQFFGGGRFLADPPDALTLPYYKRTHVPSVTWCDSGDLLATAFTAPTDGHSQMAILISRLRAGSDKWDPTARLFIAPDHNVTSGALYHADDGTIHHYNGIAAPGGFATIRRVSTDNGATWSKPEVVNPRPERQADRTTLRGQPRLWPHMDIFKLSDGRLAMPSEPSSMGGTCLFASSDDGRSWQEISRWPWNHEHYAERGGQAGWIAGIHAPVVELRDGHLLAYGRGYDIDGTMPQSISSDGGRTWSYQPSPFPAITTGQRPVMRRLAEGPILFVSLSRSPWGEMADGQGKPCRQAGIYATVSLDEGKTWGHRRLIPLETNEPRRSETGGYLSCVQTPDGMIHLVSSRRYYGFNLAWLMQSELPTTADKKPATKSETVTNSLGMRMVRIEPGSFRMGCEEGQWDERPVHRVTISRPLWFGVTEVTNAQYEQFDPGHKKLRGKLGFSKEDDEAVVFVSYSDAVAFCEWLSRKEGKTYRLPTEAEWEYACRAGTTTAFYPGDELPKEYEKNVGMSWFPGKRSGGDVVALHVGRTPPNPWGLRDMHGNVEEWCADWYGPYAPGPQTDPMGRADGDFRVTRGGSHSTTVEFLRSANRSGTLPEDKSWLIGFRVVEAERPSTEPLPAVPAPLSAQNVSQKVPADLTKGPDPTKPYFVGPRVYVKEPPPADCPVFNRHNHCPAIVNCPNGDLLAIWYTCRTEPGRELGIVASRLPYGADQWQPASNFWDAPDRNDHASALWVNEKGVIYHFNGLSAAATWGSLAAIMRTSRDNGATWSKARLIMPEHGLHHMPIESVLRTREGAILVPCDAAPGAAGGSAVLVSRDDGQTWTDPSEGRPEPDFSAGSTGAWIAGIHAGFVQLADGRLMAFGRGNDIDGRMPMSISADLGRSWTYSASPFPPISGGQRLVVLRLAEGPILLCSFGREVRFRDAAGNGQVGSGLFAAVSTDEGRSWQIKRLVTDDGRPGRVDGGGNTHEFTMSATSAEPRGYMSICQAADGVIHLISSKQHYAFNLAWLNTPPPAPPEPVELKVKGPLPIVYRPEGLPSQSGWRYNGTGLAEKKAVEAVAGGGIRVATGPHQRARWVGETKTTFPVRPGTAHTVEITMRVTRSTSPSRGIDLESYVPGVGRALITVTTSGVFWYGQGADRIAEGLDNASAEHTYRLAVGADGQVQIFRDSERLAVRSATGGPDRLAGTTRAYVQWGEGAGASEADAVVTSIACDAAGAYRPATEGNKE